MYTYGTLPEDDKGNILQVTTADVAFRHLFRADQTLLFYYRLSDNATTKILTRSLGFGYESKLRHNGKFEIAYSIDANGFADRYDHSNHFHVAYERQLNADNFLTFSSEIRSHDSKGLVDEIQANIDFRRRF